MKEQVAEEPRVPILHDRPVETGELLPLSCISPVLEAYDTPSAFCPSPWHVVRVQNFPSECGRPRSRETLWGRVGYLRARPGDFHGVVEAF